MPTVVDLTEQELSEIKALTKQRDASDAVRVAMLEYIRFARRMQLKELSGQVSMEENWPTLEASELKAQDGPSGAGTR